MLIPYKVLLPDWVFDQPGMEKELAEMYLQRYPHYHLIKIDGRLAVCERVSKEE